MKHLDKPSASYASTMLAGICFTAIMLVVVPLGAFSLILLGAWQVIDAIWRIIRGDRRRVVYLIAAFLFLAVYIRMGGMGLEFRITKWAFYYSWAPLFLFALWYWNITRTDALSDPAAAK